MPPEYEIQPAAARARLDSGQAIFIDVREPHEFALAQLDGAELIPMNTVPARLSHLEALAEDKLLIVYCHHGVRSLHVVDWLRRQDVSNCVSLAGGIDRWSTEIDPTVPRY